MKSCCLKLSLQNFYTFSIRHKFYTCGGGVGCCRRRCRRRRCRRRRRRRRQNWCHTGRS